MTYTIKPLVWTERGAFGEFTASPFPGRIYIAGNSHWECLQLHVEGPTVEASHTTDSLEQAKAAAEAHWHDTLKQALEPA